MNDEKLKHLQELVTPIIIDAKLELFDLSVKMYRGTSNVELLIDRPDGGIVIDECADINRKVAQAIDEDGVFGDDYTVSVSSPGLDWPLKTAKDFRRLIGQNIDVEYLADDQNVKKEGTLLEVQENTIVLKILEEKVSILLEKIKKALLII